MTLLFMLMFLLQDFHLQPTSPAIGTGLCLPEVQFDFDGIPRPNRPPNTRFPGDTGCEIGAFQFVSMPQTGNPVIVDGDDRFVWEHPGNNVMRFDIYVDGGFGVPSRALRTPNTNIWTSETIQVLLPNLVPGMHQIWFVACSDPAPPSAADECSQPSNTVPIDYRPLTAPDPPTNLRIGETNSAINLEWDHVINQAGFEGYNIWRTHDGSFPPGILCCPDATGTQKINPVPVRPARYRDYTAIPGQYYRYIVSTVANGFDSINDIYPLGITNQVGARINPDTLQTETVDYDATNAN